MNGKRILVPLDVQHGSLDALHFLQSLAFELPICATLLYVVNLNIMTPECRVFDDLCREGEMRLRALALLFFGDANCRALVCV